jgi:CDK inhibitor PHO81
MHLRFVVQFGKEIQSQQISGWSQFYLDYKALKKIISAAHKSINVLDSSAIGVMRPSDVLATAATTNERTNALTAAPSGPDEFSSTGPILSQDLSEPLAIPVVGGEESRGPEFQRCKALFFFKLERELEKAGV